MVVDYTNRYEVIALAAMMFYAHPRLLHVIKYPGRAEYDITSQVRYARHAGAQVVWDSSELG